MHLQERSQLCSILMYRSLLFIKSFIKLRNYCTSNHYMKFIMQVNVFKYKYRSLQMFEASYLNGIEVRCCEHSRSIITMLCTEAKCNQNPFICIECKANQKHYGHDLKVKEVIPAVKQISETLMRCKKPIEQMYKQICSDKQNDSFMKYQEQREQHCNSIRKHIQSIKFQIEEEVNNIIRMFEKQMEKQKQTMYIELEKYYENYKNKFQELSRRIGPIASIHNMFKYYNNSNILLRIMSDSDPNSSIRWFNQLKRAVKAGQALAKEPNLEIQRIKGYSSKTNQLMDRLPRVRSSDYQTHLPRILNASAKEALQQFVRFGQIKHSPSMGSLSSISRSYSMNSQAHINRNHSFDNAIL